MGLLATTAVLAGCAGEFQRTVPKEYRKSIRAAAKECPELTPKLLAADVAKSGRKVKLLITHMRPNLIPQIAEDLEHAGLETHIIAPGHVYDV